MRLHCSETLALQLQVEAWGLLVLALFVLTITSQLGLDSSNRHCRLDVTVTQENQRHTTDASFRIASHRTSFTKFYDITKRFQIRPVGV